MTTLNNYPDLSAPIPSAGDMVEYLEPQFVKDARRLSDAWSKKSLLWGAIQWSMNVRRSLDDDKIALWGKGHNLRQKMNKIYREQRSLPVINKMLITLNPGEIVTEKILQQIELYGKTLEVFFDSYKRARDRIKELQSVIMKREAEDQSEEYYIHNPKRMRIGRDRSKSMVSSQSNILKWTRPYVFQGLQEKKASNRCKV